jgi:hypothetical protein
MRVLFALISSLVISSCTSVDFDEIRYRANVNFTSKDGGVLDYVYARLKKNDGKVTMLVSAYENMEQSQSWEFEDCKFNANDDWHCTKNNVTIKMKNQKLVLTNTKSKDSDTFTPYSN